MFGLYQNTTAPSETRFEMRKYRAVLMPTVDASPAFHWEEYLFTSTQTRVG